MENRRALAGPVNLWETQRQFQIDFLRSHGLEPQHRLLDFGCGPLRGGIPIIEYLDAGNYHGVDINEDSIREARRELEENRLEYKLPHITHIRDISALRMVVSFDVIWAFSVVIHMPDEVLDEFLAFCGARLRRGGVLYMNVNIGERRTGGKFLDFDTYVRPLEFYEDMIQRHGLKIIGVEPSQRQTMLLVGVNDD